jgi:hypothetical protein
VTADRLRIVVLGYIVRGPYGGLAWHHLQYVMSLAELGHEVYFFEDSDNYPACCHPDTGAIDTDPSYGPDFATRTFEYVGLRDLWAYYDAHLSVSARREDLRSRGWIVTNPLVVTRDLRAYQNYISSSAAEFSVAKHGYVSSNSGWFSERSAAYLASGRPVITQNTGFSTWLPTGCGVLSFNDCDQALGAIEDVCCRYEAHSRAARELAQEYFDGRKVLSRLLKDIDG